MFGHIFFLIIGVIIGAFVFRNNPKKTSEILDKGEDAVNRIENRIKDELKK